MEVQKKGYLPMKMEDKFGGNCQLPKRQFPLTLVDTKITEVDANRFTV